MKFMPCGIFMQCFSSVGMHVYIVPPKIANLQIIFEVSEMWVDFLHCSQNSTQLKKPLQLYTNYAQMGVLYLH